MAPKLFWLLSSHRTVGRVYFKGGVLDPIDGTTKYLVIQFPLGKDTIEFQSNVYFHWRDDTAVMVRYSRFDPYDARLDVPACIWGDTLVKLLTPLGVWLILLLTPNRFDPLIPWGSRVRLQWRKPWIRVIALLGFLVPMMARAQTPVRKQDTTTVRQDTALLKQATVTARPVYVQKADRLVVNVDAMIAQSGSKLGKLKSFHLLCITKHF